MVINTDVDVDICGIENGDLDSIYNEKRRECFNIYIINSDGSPVDADHDAPTHKLWDQDDNYKIDKLEAYHDAYSCWVELQFPCFVRSSKVFLCYACYQWELYILLWRLYLKVKENEKSHASLHQRT